MILCGSVRGGCNYINFAMLKRYSLGPISLDVVQSNCSAVLKENSSTLYILAANQLTETLPFGQHRSTVVNHCQKLFQLVISLLHVDSMFTPVETWWK